MAGSFFYNLLLPFNSVDLASVNLATTDKALVLPAFLPNLAGFFAYEGKTLHIDMFGRITSAATPGNLTWDIYWGSGADANGTLLASSAAQAMTATQANMSWSLQLDIECQLIGSVGKLMVTGQAIFNEAIIVPHMLIPATAPAQSGAVDLSAASTISVQAKRSGSTVETIQVHKLKYYEVN